MANRSALLISPPIYDTQYWANWSLPYGLLRVATWLRDKGYVLKLIDCLEANETRKAKKRSRKVRTLCSKVGSLVLNGRSVRWWVSFAGAIRR